MLLTKALLHTTDAYVKKLREWGIETVEELLTHFPRAYKDKSEVLKLFAFVDISEANAIHVTIESMIKERTRNGKILVKAIIRDDSGCLSEAVWFNRAFLAEQYRKNDVVLLYGKPKYEYGRLSFPSPDIEHVGAKGELTPIYVERNGIPSNWFEDKMRYVEPYLYLIEDPLPEELRKSKGFALIGDSVRELHFPSSKDRFELARDELAYRELYEFQFRGLSKKYELRQLSEGFSKAVGLDAEFVKSILQEIPFPLTNHQKVALFQILKDMEKSHSMARLLQGDVGTGKTAVAAIAAIHTIKKWNVQAAIMAPTEILARQHFASLDSLFSAFGIRTDLLVGSMTEKQKTEAKARLKTGETDCIIGTHAVIQDDVRFRELGFVVIDEQHRFGVEQRKALEAYASAITKRFPHTLNMTATPIPRTLALTMYGDQDVSVIREYPVGRKPIVTAVVKESDRDHAYRMIENEVRSGRQIYWISPLVEESESLDVANATNMREYLQLTFPEFSVGLLHGRMNGKEKDSIMKEFSNGTIQILSSTSVVEVGVDNPNATVICIEWAERFGLSQLHQFRGRVGRGGHQSYCYLLPTKETPTERLKAMEKTNDGFELSEIDLELRGPGEVYGVRQSGLPDFKIADLTDLELVSEIRDDIEKQFERTSAARTEKGAVVDADDRTETDTADAQK